MQITDYLTGYSALDISVPHMMRTAFRAVSTARRLGGFRWAHARQPRATSALLVARSVRRYSRHVARRRRVGREVRDKGVTYYSVDLGRVQRGGRDNDADRDVTVIPVIPGRRPHQGRCRGAGHHRPGPARAAKGPAGDGVAPGVGTLGHQFQLRMARSSSLSGRCRRAGSPVPVAHCRSSRSQGFLEVSVGHQFQLRTAVPSVVAGAFGRGRSHGFPLCCRAPSRAGLRGGHQVQLRIAYSFAEPPWRWAGRATRLSAVAGSTVITAGTGLRIGSSPPPPCASHQW